MGATETKKEKDTAKVKQSSQTMTFAKAVTNTVSDTDSANTDGKTPELDTLESTTEAKETETEKCTTQMEVFTRVNGRITKEMEPVIILIPTEMFIQVVG